MHSGAVPVSLEDLRRQLSELDRQLVSVVAERQRIVAEIGRTKRSSGTGTRDFSREKEVIELARQHAAEMDVPEDLAETLMRQLIRASLTSQEQSRVVAEGRGTGQRALVIGGAGRMGRWFVDFLASQGYDVGVADPAGAPAGFRQVDNWEESGLSEALIVVAAPLRASAAIMDRRAELKPEGLIMDIGSLKSPLKNSLHHLHEAGCRVASVHPMFGPDTRLLSGRHVIFVDTGQPASMAEARELFKSTMAEQVAMSLDEHDRIIAYVLGLSHALSIAFFTALNESHETAPTLARMSSTTFDAQLAVSSGVAGESPQLYFEIQSLNEHGREPLAALEEAVTRLRKAVETGDEDGFAQMMRAGREYLASLPARPA